MEIHNYLNRLLAHEHLSRDDAARVFQIFMMGGATPAQMAAILTAFRMNGETVEEISGAAHALRLKGIKLEIPPHLQPHIMDNCGTGGDAKGTYNISTAASFVLAACGVPVVKHGNKSISSGCGSADVLRELGVNIEASPEHALRALEETNICFLYAPKYQPAMRHVTPVRQELCIRTMFNLLGPLINPAAPTRQLVGVYAKEWVRPLAYVLDKLGVHHAWVVHGADGMDEISLTGETFIAELNHGAVRTFSITPEQVGLERLPDLSALQGGNVRNNAEELMAVLSGKESPLADAVAFNAAAGLVVAGRAKEVTDGLTMAREVMADGRAKEKVKSLVEYYSAA